MQDPDKMLRNLSRRSKSETQDNPEAIELAYRLQTAPPNDIDLLKQLVHRYTGDLYRWVGVLLYYRNMTYSSREEIVSVLIKVFSQAIKHADQFHGLERVSDWLFGIGYQFVKLPVNKHWSKKYPQTVNQGENHKDLPNPAGSAYWYNLDRLPEKIRTPLILRYLFDLGIPEIANILNLQDQEVHRRLVTGRKHLIVNPFIAHQERQIMSYVDGLLDDDPHELTQLMQHLEICDLCRSRVVKIEVMEKNLSEGIKKRWVFSPPNNEELDAIIYSIVNEMNQLEKKGWKVQPRLGHAAWVFGFVLTFIGMSIVLIRFTAFDAALQPPDITPTQNLPPIIEMLPGLVPSRYLSTIPGEPEYVEPAFSSDGNWAVFASIKSVPNYWGRSLPAISVYNRESNTTQVISQGTTPSDKPWIWWDLAPSISGDGHLIAYVSSSKDPSLNGDPCETSDHEACLDVFLYEPETGTSRRLTQSVNGGPADGDSLAPTVSEDGNVVAFWSTAENLVNGYKNSCQQSVTRVTCLFIYIYNLETGIVEWIPVPAVPGDPVYGVDRISLSANGQYVGFTATPAAKAGPSPSDILITPDIIGNPSDGTVLIPSIPGILHSSEVMVYDRETGKYELENQAPDGTPGNGESFSPVLSADGLYVAFSSFSNNIVAGDRNNASDVFLRNRRTGEVELISVSTVGMKGRSDSGLSVWGKGYFSLNISSDGRYVIFESTATNLGQDLNSDCNKVDISNCNYLYVHDRQTGTTDWITAVPNPDFIFFPEISSDGRWISFMQSFHNCSTTQIQCSNVMLYDRQRSWMTNLTKYEQTIPTLGWSYSDSLVIPWQTWESTALAFSSDGKLIALGGADSKVRLWKISDGNQSVNKDAPTTVLETDSNDVFSAVAFTSDGELLAAGTTTGSISVWKLSDGKLQYSMTDQPGLIRKLVFSNDGTYLVFSTDDGVWIWSFSDNQVSMVDDYTIGNTFFNAVDISVGGNLFASARSDGLIWLQKLPGGKVIGRVSANDYFVSNLVFSNDGTLLAVRSSVGAISLWQVDGIDSESPSIKLVNTFRSYVYDGALAFSSDNKFLASSGIAGGITLYDVPEGNLYSISSSPNIGTVFSLAFSKDGNKLASVFENEIVLWGLHTDRSSHYFVYSLEGRYIDALPLPAPSASDIPALQTPENISLDDKLSLDQAAALLNFSLIVPSHLPANINFVSASVNKDGSVLLRYDADDPELYQATLYIYEKNIGDSPPPTMTIGAGADVLLTQVETNSGSASAEYVQGDWFWRQSYTPPIPGSSRGGAHNVWDWDLTSNSQRLRWQQNGVMIALYYQAYPLYSPLMRVQSGNDKITYVSSILKQADLEQIGSRMIPFEETGSGTTAGIPDQLK